MAKFQRMPKTNASWVQYMHHGEIRVEKGIAETDNPLTRLFLLRHGFVELIEKCTDAPEEPSEPASEKDEVRAELEQLVAESASADAAPAAEDAAEDEGNEDALAQAADAEAPAPAKKRRTRKKKAD